MLLEHIASPRDVKALDATALPQLCDEVRRAILENAAAVGGHLAPNLGVVELTVALHRVFDSPRDKIIFDVSHQSYAHKVLTGRAAAFTDPAHYGEVSGFSNPHESEHDFFSMGHTSTSISLACGLAKARDLAGERYDVVAVIGDGSLSGGLAFEGLDNAAVLNSGIVIVVDYRYLEEGNDVDSLVEALEALRGIDHPVVLHVHTTKGAGYDPAERAPEVWHHVGSFDIESGRKHTLISGDVPEGTYADITGAHLLEAMKRNPRVVGVTAGMPYVMGFTQKRRAQAGQQFVDVGIAEEHAVTFITSLAAAGASPVFGVYGAFLQRSYDELWHDLCLNCASATILDIGASVFGASAETHLNYFDLAMLGSLPNLRVFAPTCVEEYLLMLDWSLGQRELPVVIRVPGTKPVSRPDLVADFTDAPDFSKPTYRVVKHGQDVAVLALGDFFELGERVVAALAEHGIQATLVNPRFASEFDEELISSLPDRHRVVVTLEDGVLAGGWGEKIARRLSDRDVRVRCYGIDNHFHDRFDPRKLLEQNGVTVEGIIRDITSLL